MNKPLKLSFIIDNPPQSMLKFSELLALKESLPLTQGVRVAAAHPCGLIALEKPPTIKSHPNPMDKEAGRALLEGSYDLKTQCYTWKDADGSPREFHLINRLDAPTSGVLLGAQDKELADTIRTQFAHRQVHKTYYAVVKGCPARHPDYWVDKLSRKEKDGKLLVEEGNDFHAKTRMEWIARDSDEGTTSLLKLMPVTGRTHQLRVQCALRGYPIVGDRKYGDFTFNREIAKRWELKRLFLHAQKTELEFIYQNETIHFVATSELPLAFMKGFPSVVV